jgi:hypothetical protein
MFASTIRARKVLRLAFEQAGEKIPLHTYTERTTDRDENRRSIVFPCYGDSVKVVNIARKMFRELGFYGSVPKITRCDSFGHNEYIRLIAYKNK